MNNQKKSNVIFIKSKYKANSLSYLGFNYYKKQVGDDVLYVFEDTRQFRIACLKLQNLRTVLQQLRKM